MSRIERRSSQFKRLKTALEEGVQFAKGQTSLRTVPCIQRPPDFHARDVLRMRRRLGMSQTVFAQMLNVSPKTVQSWEQGDRKPSRSALRLLQMLNEQPEQLCEMIGVSRDLSD